MAATKRSWLANVNASVGLLCAKPVTSCDLNFAGYSHSVVGSRIRRDEKGNAVRVTPMPRLPPQL